MAYARGHCSRRTGGAMRKRRLAKLGLAGAAALVAGGAGIPATLPAHAAETVTISGTVIDAYTQAPLAGADVTADSVGGPPATVTAQSDAAGHYVITGLPPG